MHYLCSENKGADQLRSNREAGLRLFCAYAGRWFPHDTAHILLTNEFSIPYRKDRTNHGGGILAYINNNLLHKRKPDHESFCGESVRVEIKINNQQYLLGTFYSPKPHDQTFFEALVDQNI